MITVQNLCKTYKVAKRGQGSKKPATIYLSVNTRRFMRSIISVSRLVTEKWSDTLAKMELARVQPLKYSAAF